MRKVNKIFIVLFFMFLSFAGCRKEKYYVEEFYYIKNNTDDTLKIKFAEKIYSSSFSHPDTVENNFILLKQQSKMIYILSNYVYYQIRYKNIDVRFTLDSVANNYKANFFNLQDWERKTQIRSVYVNGSKELVGVNYNYIFYFDTLKIIHKNE